MTKENNYEPVKTIGNNIATDFSFVWAIISNEFLKVYLEDTTTGVQTLQVEGVDYTLTWDEYDDTGGLVVFGTAPTSSNYVVLARIIDLNQPNPYRTSRGFNGKSVEDSLDHRACVEQDLNDELIRCIKFQVGSGSTNITLPEPVAGKALLWNAAENKVINSTDDFNDIVTDATTQANASAASASASASSASAAAADVVLTNADVVLTGLDVASTNADVVSTNADVVTTNADVVLTNADVVLTGLDVISTNADVVSAAASAAAAEVAKIEWQGTYSAVTAYALNDAVTYNGSSYICIQAGTGQTPAIGGTAYWDDLANKGDTGASGDGIFNISASLVKTAAHTISATDDKGKTIRCNGTFPVTAFTSAAANDGFVCQILNVGTGTITLTGFTGDVTSLAQNESVTIWSDYNDGTASAVRVKGAAKVPDATTTVKGIVEKATAAELTAKTADKFPDCKEVGDALAAISPSGTILRVDAVSSSTSKTPPTGATKLYVELFAAGGGGAGGANGVDGGDASNSSVSGSGIAMTAYGGDGSDGVGHAVVPQSATGGDADIIGGGAAGGVGGGYSTSSYLANGGTAGGACKKYITSGVSGTYTITIGARGAGGTDTSSNGGYGGYGHAVLTWYK